MLTLANRLRAAKFTPMSLTYVSNTVRDNYNATITFPADIQSGDLLIVYQVIAEGNQAFDPGNLTGVAYSGSGFTKIQAARSFITTSPYQSVQHYCSYKIADGTEASAAISGFFPKGSSFAYTKAVIVVYRPIKPISFVQAVAPVANFVNWDSSPNGGSVSILGSAVADNRAIIYSMFQGNSASTTQYTWGGSSDFNLSSGGTFTDSRLIMWTEAAGNTHGNISASDTSTNWGIHFLCHAIGVK